MGFLEDTFGSKVDVPGRSKLDIEGLQQQQIKANQKSLPAASKLASATNQAAQQDLLSQLNTALPGASGLLSLFGEQLGSGLRGELPQDVQDLINQQANVRGFSTGNSNSLRNLGLTSLDRIDDSLRLFSASIPVLQQSLTVRALSPADMFLSPSQRIGLEQAEINAQFARDLQAAIADAQPDPVNAAIASEFFDITSAAIGGALGGGMGGGGGSNIGAGARGTGTEGSTFFGSQGTNNFMLGSFAGAAA